MIPPLSAQEQNLVEHAIRVRDQAYAPYSRFPVGAALLSTDGQVFCGCNVENISFGLTMCAERVAVGAALTSGISEFSTIVIVADTALPISPCGACRQVLAEFNENLILICATIEGDFKRFSLAELFPRAKTGILDQPI